MSTHVCFTFFFPIFIRCHQTTEPLSQLPQSTTLVTTTTRLATTTATRSRLTTRSRIGGPKAGGLRLSIVAFILPRLCEGLPLSLYYICTQISNASADACMHRAMYSSPRGPGL